MGRMKNGAKYMLIVFNQVFMIFSLLLIGLGVAFSFKLTTLLKQLPMGDQLILYMPSWVPWKMFFVGLTIFLICILGCYGASNKTFCALVMYAIILFVLIILQVILGVLVYIYFFRQFEQVQVNLNSTRPDVISPQNARELLNAQEKFNCCGMYGKSDGDYSVYGKTLSELVKFCCPSEIEKYMPDKASDDGDLPDMNAVWKLLLKSWLEWKPIILGVSIGLICLQVSLAVSALYLAKATANSR